MKMKNPSHIDRRTFLKSTGVSLALPFMDSLASAAGTKAAKPPVRLAFMYMPHGVIMDQFWPQNQKAFLTALQPILNSDSQALWSPDNYLQQLRKIEPVVTRFFEDVMVMDLNLDRNQFPVQLVAGMDKLDQVRVFLRSNRHAQIVVDLENKFLHLVENVKVLVKNKLERKYPPIYQKVLMMVLELDYQEREKRV